MKEGLVSILVPVHNAAAYLPATVAKPYLDAGKLHLVAEAPRFPYPLYVVWRDDLPEDLAALARRALLDVAQGIGEYRKPSAA